jgi:hypothetical protein
MKISHLSKLVALPLIFKNSVPATKKHNTSALQRLTG